METSGQPPIDSTEARALLEQIMPKLGLALWEAWTEPLELISLHAGSPAHRPLGLRPTQIKPGILWTENVYPMDRQQLQRHLLSVEPNQRHQPIDYRIIVGNGELLWVRHWILNRQVDRNRGGRHRLRGLLMPIPEQKHLEWECLRVSEHERNRIGQELHDDLCQVLSGLSLMMRVLSQRAAKVAPGLGAEIHELNGHVLGATDRVRSMAHGLFPAQLNCATVRDALQEFVRQTKARFPVKLTLELPRKLPQHSPEQIIHVFRIAQEAVSNAVRHGQASAIRIALHAAGEGMQLDVEDNGTGLPASSARPEGIGMYVMQYRARMLGGTVQFNNVSPHGAAAHLVYPIAARVPRPRNR